MQRLGVVRHLSEVVRVEILPAHRAMDEMLGLSILTRFMWPHVAPVWQSSRPAYAHRRASNDDLRDLGVSFCVTLSVAIRRLRLVRGCLAKIERRAGDCCPDFRGVVPLRFAFDACYMSCGQAIGPAGIRRDFVRDPGDTRHE